MEIGTNHLLIGTLLVVAIVAVTIILQRGNETSPENSVAAVAASATPPPSTAAIRSERPADFADTISSPLVTIIDIRTPEEYNEGHISGAIQVDFYAPTFQNELAKLDKSKPYAIYCRSGNRTGQTLALMRSLGFTNVTDLSGGLVAWQQTGRLLCTTKNC